MKKVYKYGTGQEIPEGAVYLSTVVEKKIDTTRAGELELQIERNMLVWHYFLVEV